MVTLVRALMDFIQALTTVITNIILSVSALHAAYQLYKNHRASSIGFLLIGCSSVLSVLSHTYPPIVSIQKDLEWAGETFGPALSTFDFLWLSEDRLTARIFLFGSTLLLMLSDWLTADGLIIMSCCLAFSSLSCSLTVCAFAENATGAVGSVALSVSLFVSSRSRYGSVGSLVSPEVRLLGCTLKIITALGCWTTRKALDKYLLDLKDWN